MQYSEKFKEDNKCNSVKAQKLKEKNRSLRDIRKAFYHHNVLVFWLKKNKYFVELEKPTNYGNIIEEVSSGNVYLCIGKMNFDITTMKVSKKEKKKMETGEMKIMRYFNF